MQLSTPAQAQWSTPLSLSCGRTCVSGPVRARQPKKCFLARPHGGATSDPSQAANDPHGGATTSDPPPPSARVAAAGAPKQRGGGAVGIGGFHTHESFQSVASGGFLPRRGGCDRARAAIRGQRAAGKAIPGMCVRASKPGWRTVLQQQNDAPTSHLGVAGALLQAQTRDSCVKTGVFYY